MPWSKKQNWTRNLPIKCTSSADGILDFFWSKSRGPSDRAKDLSGNLQRVLKRFWTKWTRKTETSTKVKRSPSRREGPNVFTVSEQQWLCLKKSANSFTLHLPKWWKILGFKKQSAENGLLILILSIIDYGWMSELMRPMLYTIEKWKFYNTCKLVHSQKNYFSMNLTACDNPTHPIGVATKAHYALPRGLCASNNSTWQCQWHWQAVKCKCRVLSLLSQWPWMGWVG